MGTNKRYADAIDERAHAKQVARAFAESRPHTLSAFELELDRYAVTTTPRPVPCWVWVSYPDVVAKVSARAVSWTARAVKVQWDVAPGRVHEAWVWLSASTPRESADPNS